MKLIKAVWENRNLGRNAYEIILNKNDLKFFSETIDNIRNQNFRNAYVVIKMPVGNLSALHFLEDEGFRFLETQLFLKDYFSPLKENWLIQDISENIKEVIVPKQQSEWERIIQKITPDMFDTDRISLDEKLGPDKACKRYQNWCRDLFHKPEAYMLVLKDSNTEVAFRVEELNPETNEIKGILGGVFKEFKGDGYGPVLMQNKESNFKIKTAVSSNNLPVLKIHQTLGRIIYKEMYVLRKFYD